MSELMNGELALCSVCRTQCGQWWRGPDFYACVHDACRGGLAILEGRTAVVSPGEPAEPVRRGAYARRAAASTRADWFISSRWRGVTGWLALAETSAGHLMVPCGGNAGHGTYVVRHWGALTGHGYPVRTGGVMAVGAALLDPAGTAVVSWGVVPVVGSPRWEPLRQASAWGSCVCGSYVWPGRWVSATDGRCRWCSGGNERPWPVDSDFPGEPVSVKTARS